MLKRQMKIAALLIAALITVVSCSNDNNSSAGPPDIDGTGVMPGQALLGPIVNASVKVYDGKDYEGIPAFDDQTVVDPVCETTTTDSDILDEAGLILLPAECIEADHIYLIEVVGGSDIDVNDDGVLDETPTVNDSSIHTVITGERMLMQNWKVTRVTEAIYRVVRQELQFGQTPAQLLALLDQLAVLIVKDVTGDEIVDHNDIFEWNPRYHSDLFDAGIIQTDEAFSTLSSSEVNAKLGNIVGHVDTISKANFVVAKGGYAFVTTNSALLVVDISNPAQPRIVDSIATDAVLELFIEGDYLYVLQQMDSRVYDISEPGVVRLVASTILPLAGVCSTNNGIVWGGAYSTMSSGLRLFKIGDAESALLPLFVDFTLENILDHALGNKKFPNEYEVVSISPSVADLFKCFGNKIVIGFLGFTETTIHIVDMSDINNINLVSEIVIPGFGHLPLDAMLYENELHLSVGHGDTISYAYDLELLMFSFSDPDNPVEITAPLAPIRTFTTLNGGVYAWEADDRLTSRQVDSYELINSLSTPAILDSSFQTWANTLKLTTSLDPTSSEDMEEAMKAAALTKYNYKYNRRLFLNEDYLYFAAAEYGLLIYPLP